ncbi:unnamed protein product [Periconia digitata]|uniref:Domain of unknown function at the cortex 1 domain-containing protein n=1 Tax=Periconia digitata TaxID=1303443 RepID=A0A9W4U9D7_9PLEO|nr:unnamed protein product [Periconia digitata]
MRGSEGGVIDPAARDKYLLRVTAGSSYDTSTHREVAVNGDDAHVIENDLMTCYLKVKIRDYHGLPRGSPSSSKYFSHPLHTSDRYSIGFSFIPKRDIKGNDLVTGFDFDHSIRDRLPPGFRYAMKIVTTILDPGIYSDPYSDKPYLYGPGLSSFFGFRIGEHTSEVSAEQQLNTHDTEMLGVIEEGAHGSGQRIRADQHIPAKTSKRRKHFLEEKNRDNFVFEAGRMYQADFFNPYLDFANFALRIPGFSISVVRYIDDKTHALRFVLKDRSTDEVLFVVIFNLLFGQQLEETLQGEEKERAEAHKNSPAGSDQTENVEPPDSSSSLGTPTSVGSRSSSLTPQSDADDKDRETRQDKATTASMLASSIYSGFASLGFGRTASTSGSETTSKEVSCERAKSKKAEQKTLEDKVEEMDETQVEAYLKAKASSAT